MADPGGCLTFRYGRKLPRAPTRSSGTAHEVGVGAGRCATAQHRRAWLAVRGGDARWPFRGARAGSWLGEGSELVTMRRRTGRQFGPSRAVDRRNRARPWRATWGALGRGASRTWRASRSGSGAVGHAWLPDGGARRTNTRSPHSPSSSSIGCTAKSSRADSRSPVDPYSSPTGELTPPRLSSSLGLLAFSLRAW